MSHRQERIEKWSRTRQMGMVKYIFYFGIIGWGLVTGVMWGVLMSLMDGFSFTSDNLRTFIVGMIIFPIGGILFGAVMWWWSEREYRKATR